MSKKAKAIIYWSIVGVLIAVILVSVGMIIHKLATDAHEQQLYDQLADHKNDHPDAPPRPTTPNGTVTAPSTKPGTTPTTPLPTLPRPDDTPNPETNKILPQYREAYGINSDMIGWIQIPGTKVDYPVVQSPYSDDYYLRRNFYKKGATCGTIYAREECSIDPASDNIVLYGHNMQNGTMFHDLINYKDQDYWKKHRYIYFDTLTEYHTYEIFAVFVTSAKAKEGYPYHLFNNATSVQAYDRFVSQCQNLSYYSTGITPQYGEKLLTLSTCDKTVGYGNDGRLVVVARRVV